MRLQLKQYLVIYTCAIMVMTLVFGLGLAVHEHAANPANMANNGYRQHTAAQCSDQSNTSPEEQPAKKSDAEKKQLLPSLSFNIMHFIINRFKLNDMLVDEGTGQRAVSGEVSVLT